METNQKNALWRFRMVAIFEGISFLVLLGIAMPLKYYAGLPWPVKGVGWIHGVLFILFIIALMQVAWLNKWSILKIIVAFISSLIPFGTFVLDYYLKKENNVPEVKA